jgi:hypothetical protein
MQRNMIIVQGFNSGETDFAALESRSSASTREHLSRLLDRLVRDIVAPRDTAFNSVVIVGHSDRQDLSTMSCDQRRYSEHEAALKRAASARGWLLDRIDDRLVAAGHARVQDRNDIQNMTWDMVFAGAGDLYLPAAGVSPYQTPPPQTEDQRRQNRRVVFLVSPAID